MKITEIELKGMEKLQFNGKHIATIKRITDSQGRVDSLYIHYETGSVLELPTAVDVSEQLECPRIFIIEGTPLDLFVLFGGVKAYWVSTDGKVQSEFSLFRRSGEEEYWTTVIKEKNAGIIIIYEAGVLAINETLQVQWHEPKFFNDDFVGIEGDALNFVRDHDLRWLMRLQDGAKLPPLN
jgi:hypothetical protein